MVCSGALARLEHVHIVCVKAEIGHPVVKNKPKSLDHHPASEPAVDTMGDRHQITKLVGNRERGCLSVMIKAEGITRTLDR